MQLWTWASGTNQQVKIADEGNGYYHFVFRHSGKCLRSPGTSNSVQLQQYGCDGSDNQSFRFANS